MRYFFLHVNFKLVLIFLIGTLLKTSLFTVLGLWGCCIFFINFSSSSSFSLQFIPSFNLFCFHILVQCFFPFCKFHSQSFRTDSFSFPFTSSFFNLFQIFIFIQLHIYSFFIWSECIYYSLPFIIYYGSCF